MRDLATHGATMALFMSSKQAEELQAELLAGGFAPETRCAVGSRVSWADEVVLECRLEELAATIEKGGVERHTLILVGPALGEEEVGS